MESDAAADRRTAEFVELLQQQQRVVSAFPWGENVVAEIRLARPGRSIPVPYVCVYEWRDEQWRMIEAHGDAIQPQSADAEQLLFIGPDRDGRNRYAIWATGGGQSRVLVQWDRPVQSYAVSNMRVVALVGARSETSRTPRGTSGDSRAEQESAQRFPAGFDGAADDLACFTVDIGGGEGQVIDRKRLGLGPSEQLTGECALTDRGTVVALGIVRTSTVGDRRHGLVMFSFIDLATYHLIDDHHDLTRPRARPGSSDFACLAETLAYPGLAPRQSPAIVAFGEGVRVLVSESELWFEPHEWISPDELVCLALHEGVRRVWILHLDGSRMSVQPFLSGLRGSAMSVRSDGRLLVVVCSGIDFPPEILITKFANVCEGVVASDLWMRHSPASMPAEERCLERLLMVTTAGTLGGWLCLPTTFSGALPVVVLCHGGPASSWAEWSWRWNPWIFVDAGYAVALIDPPLSLGYGNEVHATGWGRWSRVATVAVEQIDAILIDERLDRSKLFVMGASFGGWLALAIAALKEDVRFVASHAGWSDHRAVARASDQFWHWRREYGPLESPQYDVERLALQEIREDASVFISHGSLDWHVPASEAVGMSRELLNGSRRVERMIFPDEGHALSSIQNIIDWTMWVLSGCAAVLEGSANDG